VSEDITLLTGGISGVGGAAAPQLAEAGGTVLVTGRNRRAGEAVADEIGTAHPDAEGRFLRVDFADFDAIRGLARTVRRDYDRLDALVNNAGTASDERAVVDGVQRTLAVNHLAPLLLTACLAPQLFVTVAGLASRVAAVGPLETASTAGGALADLLVDRALESGSPVYVDRQTAAGATDETLRARLRTRSAELVGGSAWVPAVGPLD